MFGKRTSFDKNNIQSVIAACLKGNELAQVSLIDMNLKYAKHICMPYVSNRLDIQDIINEGFLKVFDNLNKYDPARPFQPWFKTILINTAIDHYRSTLNARYDLNIDDIDIVYDGGDVISKMSADEITDLVQNLPNACRLVFNLYVLEGYSHKQIAEVLNIEEGTSRSNLRDARRKLRKTILERYPHFDSKYSSKEVKFYEN